MKRAELLHWLSLGIPPSGRVSNGYTHDHLQSAPQPPPVHLHKKSYALADSNRSNKGTERSGESQNVPEALSGARGSGSGIFFVGSAGFLVTNAHVVDGAERVEILHKGKVHKAKVVQVDSKLDLALLKVDEATQGLMILPHDAEAGEEVFTIGFPRPTIQGIEVKVTKGIIRSQKGLRDDNSCYQLDASIQPGNSGGPVCDSKGRLVGVVVSMLDQLSVASATGSIPQNVNYAIKVSIVSSFLDSQGIKTGQSDGSGKTDEKDDSIKNATAATAMVIAR